MSTRQPIKRGAEFIADTTTRETFNGLDTYSLIYLDGPIPEKTIDVVKYNVDYIGSKFAPYSSVFSPSWGAIHSFFDPNSAAPIDQIRFFDQSNSIDMMAFIDRVYFNNGVVMREHADPGFAVQGLYEYLGRDKPDVGGFNYWLSGYDERGVSLVTLADDFIRIKSEAAASGSLTADPKANKDFVLYLYESILERSGDQQGVDFWTNSLDNGLVSRAEVLAEFIEVNGETSWYSVTSGQTQPFGGWEWIELA